MPRIHPLMTALVAAAFLATPAHALYMQTPLLVFGPEHAEVGDGVTFDIEPENDTAIERFSGKTVHVYYLFNPQESADPDAPVSSDGLEERLLGEVVLDGEARATFQWTVPEEVHDLNVDIAVRSGDEQVAFGYLAIGDAPPSMRILAASGPGPVEPDQESAPADSEDASGLGVALLAGLGLVAVLRRK